MDPFEFPRFKNLKNPKMSYEIIQQQNKDSYYRDQSNRYRSIKGIEEEEEFFK